MTGAAGGEGIEVTNGLGARARLIYSLLTMTHKRLGYEWILEQVVQICIALSNAPIIPCSQILIMHKTCSGCDNTVLAPTADGHSALGQREHHPHRNTGAIQGNTLPIMVQINIQVKVIFHFLHPFLFVIIV